MNAQNNHKVLRSMLFGFIISACLGGFSGASSAASINEAEAGKLVKSSIDRALEVLRNPSFQGKEHRTERHQKLRAISDEIFDWSAMAQRSLGVHWRKIDESQRKRFTSTFRELLADHYLNQIDRFQGKEDVVHEGATKSPEGFEVKTNLITQSKEKIPMSFFMSQEGRVFDVSIEGVSIANHYRGSFNRILVNGTFDDLMKRLEQKRAATTAVPSKEAG